jgi:hypothetical protein
MQDQLAQLRAVLTETQNKLIEAEAELADRLAEVNAFEFEFEASVGHLIDQLEALEADIQRYNGAPGNHHPNPPLPPHPNHSTPPGRSKSSGCIANWPGASTRTWLLMRRTGPAAPRK